MAVSLNPPRRGLTVGSAPRQLDMFENLRPPRAKPRILMHVTDAGQVHCGREEDLGKPLCRMRCTRCAAESEWLVFDTVTEAKRGIPCPNCNDGSDAPLEACRG
jgi:hypothetical protein